MIVSCTAQPYAARVAYRPLPAMRLAWLPVSMMWPWSRTTIWSASRTVDSRWAIVMVVRPRARASNACCTARSVSVSRALVAQQGPGDGDALLLAAGEPVPARADHGVVAV